MNHEPNPVSSYWSTTFLYKNAYLTNGVSFAQIKDGGKDKIKKEKNIILLLE